MQSRTVAEESFARSQSLWLLRDDWRRVERGPTFEQWVASLDNRTAGTTLPAPLELPRESVWEQLATRRPERRRKAPG